MSDDERIARLTELARRVWPHRRKLCIDARAKIGASVVDGDPDDFECRVILDIADVPVAGALDALEAALLVLLYPKQAAWALEPDPWAWVEELAAEWERDAMEVSPVLHDCAAELRARARGER